MARTPRFISKVAHRYRKVRRELPASVSNIAMNDFKENFRRQGYRNDSGGVVKWGKRKHDKSSRATLVGKGSGRLKRSFKARPTFNQARVINNAPYAQIHNEGGDIKGKELVQEGFTKGGNPRWRRSARKATMPARPFMVTTKPLEREIEKELFDELEKIFK